MVPVAVAAISYDGDRSDGHPALEPRQYRYLLGHAVCAYLVRSRWPLTIGARARKLGFRSSVPPRQAPLARFVRAYRADARGRGNSIHPICLGGLAACLCLAFFVERESGWSD